jgi:hypothetical protein
MFVTVAAGGPYGASGHEWIRDLQAVVRVFGATLQLFRLGQAILLP